MWYAIIMAMGLLDDQPMVQIEMRSAEPMQTEGQCLQSMESAKIHVATKITMLGLQARFEGRCVKLTDG